MELYKTVRKEAEASQTIERSKFTAHVKPVKTKEEADEFIASIKSKYKDATHNVPAMVIGDKFQIQWASDDGEPQGTSGAPMVQMLVKEGITDVVIVVTRYFGGIKLGTGGLVRAYTSSARLGIEAAGVCSVREMRAMEFKIDYTNLAKLQNIAESEPAERSGFDIADIQYSDNVLMKVLTFPENEEKIKTIFANITAGKAEVTRSETVLEKV